MSTQRKKRTPPNMKENDFNYFAPISSSQKKVKKIPIEIKSDSKQTGGIRKVRRTENLLFWDVTPAKSPSPVQSGKTATVSANEDVLFKDNESPNNKVIDTSTKKPRKMMKAKRHLKQNNDSNVMIDDLELQIPTHQIRTIKANDNNKADEMFTQILDQNHEKPSLVSSAKKNLKKRRSSSVHAMEESLGDTPVSCKNKKKVRLLDSNVLSSNNISGLTKSTNYLNESPLNKTSSSFIRHKSIPKVSITKDVDQTLNTTYDKLPDYDTDEKTSSVITVHDTYSLTSPSKGGSSTSFFDCPKEQLEPSLTGGVGLLETTKQRTFELEETVNNVSLLQAEAKSDFFNMNSFQNKTLQENSLRSGLNVSTPLGQSNVMTPVGAGISTPFGRSTPVVKGSTNRKSRTKKPASKVKIPNFAAIHERAMQEMENISDYKKRKEDRAKMLLSGKKPLDVTQTKESERKSKKQLRFASNTVDKPKSSTFIALPTTPMPAKRKYGSITSEQSFFADTSKFPALSNKSLINRENEKKNKILGKDNKVNTSNAKTSRPVLQENSFNRSSFSKTKVRVVNLPKAPKAKIIKPVKNEISKKEHLKKEEIKTMVSTKSNPKQNMDLKNKKRSELAGVRSNRRFDLLMQMRKGM